MSRIEQVMRELSDMRSFYLKLQASKRTPPVNESEEAEMPDAKNYTMDEVKAHLEKWSKEQHPSAYWHKISWADSTA